MINNFVTLNSDKVDKNQHLLEETKDVLLINTCFNVSNKNSSISPGNKRLSRNSINLLKDSINALKFGGLLFIYGLPNDLTYFGEFLANYRTETIKTVFKYWITLAIDEDVSNIQEILQPKSLGILMFLKTKANSRTISPFNLNTAAVRVPHSFCIACNQNVKDWGGKKHLMNPNGTALSDVWRDLPNQKVESNIIPDAVLERIYNLTKKDEAEFLNIIQQENSIEEINKQTSVLQSLDAAEFNDLSSIPLNEVYQGDCVSFLEKVSELNPEGLFDLAFADPPYNLKKEYGEYDDEISDHHYIEWCNNWLAGMVKALKPGGSLIVLNLPKWSIHHATFLNKHLEFRNWITWDALSDPRGKLMPAHYTLLYYTKPGGSPILNYSQFDENPDFVQSPDSPEYCLRASCVKKRKALGNDNKVQLSDVWFDVHRIKHKRDRDAHPCQLPDKLMERIIKLTTNRGGVVFDPFCGAGTTAINSKKTGRNFVTIDLDSAYVEITKRKLESMNQYADLFGIFHVPRESTKKAKPVVTKKEIELYIQKLALKLGKMPTETDIKEDNVDMLEKIDLIYPSRRDAIKTSRIVLRT